MTFKSKVRSSDGTTGGADSPRLPLAPSPPRPVSQSPVSASRFSHHVAWTFVVRVVMVANSILAGVVVARWLGVEGVGKLAVINVAVATLVQLGSMGLPSAITYFISKDQTQFRKATINAFVFAVLGGGLLAVGLNVLVQIRPSWFGFVSPELFRVAAISIPFQLLTLIGLNIFLAIGKVKEFNLLDLAGQLFVLINAVVALVVLQSGLRTLVFLNAAASVLVALALVLFLWRSAKFLAGPSSPRSDLTLGRMIKYGIKSHIAILAGALIFRADLLIVNLFRGASEAGVYSIATQVAMMIMLLPGVIATILFPRVAAEQDVKGETTSLVARQTAFVLLLCSIAVVPLSILLPVVYGRAFSDASIQLLIMLPGVYFVGVQSVVVQHFAAMGLPKSVPVFWLVTLAVNVVLVLSLVPRFGARGAALASTISYALIALLVISRFLSETGRSFSDVFVLRAPELKTLLNFGRL